MFCLLLFSERTTRWNFNWLGRQPFWKHLQTLSSKLQNPFFSPWEVPIFQRIWRELCPDNWYLCSWVLKHTPLHGDISYDFVLQLLKSSHCLACVTSTAMTSEADAHPLTPVGQFALSESHSGKYDCMSSFIRKEIIGLPWKVPTELQTAFDVPPRFY